MGTRLCTGVRQCMDMRQCAGTRLFVGMRQYAGVMRVFMSTNLYSGASPATRSRRRQVAQTRQKFRQNHQRGAGQACTHAPITILALWRIGLRDTVTVRLVWTYLREDRGGG